MSAPPKVGDVLLVAAVTNPESRVWKRDHQYDRTVLEPARVIDGDRSTVNTHVWVQATDYTAGLALSEEGTSWVRADDDEGLKAMIAARALAGLPPL